MGMSKRVTAALRHETRTSKCEGWGMAGSAWEMPGTRNDRQQLKLEFHAHKST